MAIMVTNIQIDICESEETAIQKAIQLIKIPPAKINGAHLYKKSLDARKQNRILFVCSVLLQVEGDEQHICNTLSNPNISYRPESSFTLTTGKRKRTTPIVLVGFGPAGIFCAYLLAKYGYHPIVIERGQAVEQRIQAVKQFWTNRQLHSESNVQFGEGGAGTFSDGKLTTRISDKRCDYILKLLVEFGAPKEILTKAKPHIGTDNLRNVIRNIRNEIIRLGGTIHFEHKLENLNIQNNQLVSITVNGEEIQTQHLVLAIGHSARDTFHMLFQQQIYLEPKGFSVGVRIEHLQSEIDKGLYGKMAGHPNLPKGEYQLSYREKNRGVYTFCMCPGGVVVPSASSENTVVTNGMSEFKRDQKNANSALVVSVTPEDFGTHPLSGIDFQLQLETCAFSLGGNNYTAVASTVSDFQNHQCQFALKSVYPSYSLGVTPIHLNTLFPSMVTDMMQKGLTKFQQKIPGFAAPDAVMTGVETRTSSPVRITRNDNMQSISVQGLYPCGEGAGYAGGIMSAAVDGMKVAEQIIQEYAPD